MALTQGPGTLGLASNPGLAWPWVLSQAKGAWAPVPEAWALGLGPGPGPARALSLLPLWELFNSYRETLMYLREIFVPLRGKIVPFCDTLVAFRKAQVLLWEAFVPH